MNNSTWITSGNSPTPSDNPDLFYQKLTFDGLNISQIEYYNGCIPGRVKNTYLYDADHRLKETKNFMYTPTRVEDNYSSHYEYDKVGNIQHLTRYGFTGLDASQDPTYGLIDQLTYTYDLDFYLTGVTNDLNAASDEYGFKGGGSGYVYDLKGNMIESTLNGMIIQYNPLNLPGVISSNSASDIQTTHYSSNGTKIMTVDQYTNPPIGHPSDLTRLYFLGMELEYEGAGDFTSTFTPKAYNFGDGQVLFGGTELRYRYYLHDHLGNVVVVFEDKNGDGELEETTNLSTNEVPHRYHYYSRRDLGDSKEEPLARPNPAEWGDSFGMQWDLAQSASALPPLYSDDNRYQYNSKEYVRVANLLDYGARFYDPTIARLTSIDRFAEKYPNQSPYHYAANNPIRFIDINGDSIGVSLTNGASQEAFDAFFATNEGRAFISQYAAKGQTVNGHKFKSDGKYHREGIDLVYRDRDFGQGNKNTGGETTGGNKGGTFKNGRLKLGVSINTTAERTSLIDRVTAVTHESFLHVQEYSFDYTDNGKLDFSNDSFYSKTKNNSPSSRHHLMFHYKPNASTTHPFATKGLRVLESVNSRNNLGYSRTQLWNKLWNFWD